MFFIQCSSILYSWFRSFCVFVFPFHSLKDIRTNNIGDATQSADYSPVIPSRVTFNPGEQSFDLTIDIVNDGLVEGSESFEVEIFDADGGRLDEEYSVAEVHIIDDDFNGCMYF